MTEAMATSEGVVGLVLAAGSGSRFGTPKALVAGADGVPWVARAIDVLESGGCQSTFAVIGAAADKVRRRVPAQTMVVVAEVWAEGMGASLRAGLAAVVDQRAGAVAVVVMLVDTPGVTAQVVRRLLAKALGGPDGRADSSLGQRLIRASYGGRLGHPVLIGCDHWAGVAASARGDRAARDYLAAHAVTLVECGDIGSGVDIDTEVAFQAWAGR